MKVNRNDLLKAIESVRPGLAGKEAIEQTTSFIFQEGRVLTYNDVISISHPVEGIDEVAVIQAEEMYKLLSKFKGDEIEITISKEKNQLLLKSGRSKAGLTLQQEIKLPLDEITKPGKWKKLPDGFLKFSKFAMNSCSRDMSQPNITCVYYNEDGYIYGTDRLKITRCELDSELPVSSQLVPADSVAEIIKLNPVEIAESDGWLHFKNAEGAIISTRVFEDDYVDVDRFLEVEDEDNVLTFPKKTSDLIDCATVFARQDTSLDEEIKVKIAGGKLTIRGESTAGWYEEPAKVKYEGDDISFKIAPYLLTDILKETRECVIDDNKLKFTGDGWEYVSILEVE